jgi:hypothetical protein
VVPNGLPHGKNGVAMARWHIAAEAFCGSHPTTADLGDHMSPRPWPLRAPDRYATTQPPNLKGRGVQLGGVAGSPEVGALGVDPSGSGLLAHAQAGVLVGMEEAPELDVIVAR